jgi:hypothetical protein
MTRHLTALLICTSIVLTAETAQAQGKNRTGCGNDIGLIVTVTGTRAAPGGYALTSDGLGDYRDGTKGAAKVSAIFQVSNCTHDFTTNLASSTRAMWALLSTGDQRAWFFNLDRVASVPITPETQTDSETFAASHDFCTSGVQRDSDGQIRKNIAGWYYDNYAGCGVDELGRAYVRRGGGISLDPDDRLSFKASPIDNPNAPCVVTPDGPGCPTSYVRVYHPDANTWIVRSEPGATAAHRVWAGGNAGYAFVGYELMPLEIKAVRK